MGCGLFFSGQTIWKAKKTEEVGRKKAYVATYLPTKHLIYDYVYFNDLSDFIKVLQLGIRSSTPADDTVFIPSLLPVF